MVYSTRLYFASHFDKLIGELLPSFSAKQKLLHEKTYKKKRFQLMITCDKCYNEKHDQCMGKAGMFDCGCKCFKKIISM